MYCSGCGSKLSESSNFCTQCGKERNRVTGYSKQAWIDEDEVAREAEANAYRAKKLKQQEQQRKLLEKRRKEKAKKRQERISFLLQPKIWVSSLILLGLAAGSITMFQTQASSWTNLVSRCDSLMMQDSQGGGDSYQLGATGNTLTIMVGTDPRESEWIDCIGENLSVNPPNSRLGRTASGRLLAGYDSIVFGNLNVRTEKLNHSSFKIFISLRS